MTAFINEITIGGNLTRDVELRYVGDKKSAVAQFSVAVNAVDRNGGESAEFFTCEAWWGSAETIAKEFKKGSPIVLVGAIKTDKYEKDGVQKTFQKIRVNNFGHSISELFRELAAGSTKTEKKPKKEKEPVVTEPDTSPEIEVAEFAGDLPF